MDAEVVVTVGLLLTAFGLGLRHGIDWDHIAAIGDIASSQESSRRGMWLSTLYALGHASVVLILGILAIVFAEQLPDGIDAAMERVVGVTLLLLGGYVFVALMRHGREFRMQSRWMLLFAGIRRSSRWIRARARSRRHTVVEVVHDHEHALADAHDGTGSGPPLPERDGQPGAVATRGTHRHVHRHVAAMPEDPFVTYSNATAVTVGMLHGVGAETPTQVVIFLTAAGVAGTGTGVLLLVVFLGGLLLSNTAIAAASTFGFLQAGRNFAVYATVSVVTGALSLALGGLFLFGQGSVLPAFFG